MDTHFDLAPNTRLPRVWNGLWQLSSSAFGSAPAHRVRDAMRLHMGKGLNAFGRHNTHIINPFSELTVSDQTW